MPAHRRAARTPPAPLPAARRAAAAAPRGAGHFFGKLLFHTVEKLIGLRGKRNLFGEKVFPGQELHVRLGKVNPLRSEAVILDVREF